MASGRISGSYNGFQVNSDWSSVKNTAGNYSDVTVNHYLYMPKGWSLYIGSRTNNCTCNESKDFTSPSISNDGGSAKNIHLGTTNHRVYHNSDGSKSINLKTTFNIKATISGSYVGSIVAEGTITLDKIDREANITSATDFNDESNPTIKFNNAGGFKINARLEFAGVYINRENIPNNGSYTFSLTEEERNLLRSKCTGNSMTVREVIATCIGGSSETHWSYQDKIMTIINANPTFASSNISYKDTNTNITKITGNNQHIVQNQSNLQVSFTEAIGKKYATISSYEITFNGIKKIISSAGSIDYGKVNLSSNTSVSIKVIDSRGNSTTISKSITILGWILPTAVVKATRVNNYEDETKLKVSVTISSVNSKNSINSIKYHYKKVGTSSYSEYVSLTNNEETTVVLDKLYAWDFQVVITDKFGSTTYNFVIAKGTPIMFIDTILQAIGINCFPTEENGLSVSGFSFFDLFPVGAVRMTTNDVNPSKYFKGTWTLLASGKFFSGVDITFYLWSRTS